MHVSGDSRTTILDSRIASTDRGNKRFGIVAVDSQKYEVAGHKK